MRKIRAIVRYDHRGSVVDALVEKQSLNGKAPSKVVDGYILAPLQKSTSRAKGNTLELVTAKAFSTWLYGRPDVLRRTPLSGGWSGCKMGDISIDPALAKQLKLKEPQLYVECKNREGLLGESFFNWVASGSPVTISAWIKDTMEKAKDSKWFLVLKGRGTEPWVLTKAGLLTNDKIPCRLSLRYGIHDFILFPLSRLGDVYGDDAKAIVRGS